MSSTIRSVHLLKAVEREREITYEARERRTRDAQQPEEMEGREQILEMSPHYLDSNVRI